MGEMADYYFDIGLDQVMLDGDRTMTRSSWCQRQEYTPRRIRYIRGYWWDGKGHVPLAKLSFAHLEAVRGYVLSPKGEWIPSDVRESILEAFRARAGENWDEGPDPFAGCLVEGEWMTGLGRDDD